MAIFTALLDANVLYPAPLRDLLLQLGCSGLYRPRWTAQIHDEWISALVRVKPGVNRAALDLTRQKIDQSTPDCLIVGYETLIPALNLPDPDDRHVLAAAVVGRCEVIVTQNLKDFPPAALTPFGIEALHPDQFLANHLALEPDAFIDAIRTVLGRLKHPPYTVEQYLEILTQQGLLSTVSELRGRL